MFFSHPSDNKWWLLTMSEVKMAGYWPIKSVYFCVFKDRYLYEAEDYEHPKKNEANIQPSWSNKLDRSIMDLLHGKNKLSSGIQKAVPSATSLPGPFSLPWEQDEIEFKIWENVTACSNEKL